MLSELIPGDKLINRQSTGGIADPIRRGAARGGTLKEET